MNIWALDKDISIKTALLWFQQKQGLDHLFINQDDNLDPRSIRISDHETANLSAYIYTYGQASDSYAVQLEYPQLEGGRTNNVDTFENIPFERLCSLICVHFNMALK